MNDKRFAVLIDSDNISAKYIDCILDEMTKHRLRSSYKHTCNLRKGHRSLPVSIQ